MRLTKATNASSPFPHQTLALQPALAGWPATRWKANIAEKAAKPPYLSLHPSLSCRGAGTSKEKPPPVTTSFSQAKGRSRPEMGEQKLLQSLLSVSAHKALARGQPTLTRAPPTLKGCLCLGWWQDPSVLLMRHNGGLSPPARAKFQS